MRVCGAYRDHAKDDDRGEGKAVKAGGVGRWTAALFGEERQTWRLMMIG